jgi:acyl carrier protein
MTTREFLDKLEDGFDVERGTISIDDSLPGLGCWDSMAALAFMAIADQQLGVSVSPGQLQQCKSVKDLLALVGDKLSQ